MSRLRAVSAGSILGLLALALSPAGPPSRAVAVGPPAATPTTDPELARDRRLMADIQHNSHLIANLTHLSDAIGPRLTGSPALVKANEWAAERMRKYGLTDVRLEAWSIPEGWERGIARARLVGAGPARPLTLASMGWYPGTKGAIEGEVVYLKAQTAKELEAYRGKLKNAIILAAPPRRVPGLDQLGKPAAPTTPGAPRDFARRTFAEMAAYQKVLSGFLEKEGAAAIFQDAGKPLNLLVTTGGWGGGGPGGGSGAGGAGDRASAANRLPTLFVAHNDYALLYRLATGTGEERPRVQLEVSNRFIPGPLKVFNTVGEIKGREKPDEFVVVGAHLDSWDLGQGTTDNGTGSCVVLETARAIAASGIQPRRTIRFVLFTGEEQGLHGSRAYTERHKDTLASTSVALVHDTGTGRVKGVGTGGRPAHVSVLEKELAALRDIGVTDFKAPSIGGSDHVSFSRGGVPGFMLVQDMSTYSYTHHTQADTLDAVREPDLIQGAQAMAVSALRIAELPELLARVPSGKK